jgi:hypothetical protein
MFVSWNFWPHCILSKTIKECVREKEILRIGISYLIRVPRIGLLRVDGSLGLLHQWKRGLVLFLE